MPSFARLLTIEEKPLLLLTVPELESALTGPFNLLRFWNEQDKEFVFKNSRKIKALVVSPLFPVNGEVLDSLPGLEVVQTCSVGLDKIDLKACKERGIAVSYLPDVVTDETADTAMALVLATMRRICAAHRYVRQGLWPVHGCFPLTFKVSGKRMGIVGLGRIGASIAKRAEGFDCRISYYSRSKKPVPYTQYESLVELAENSDILVVACALTKDTIHLVNREVLNALGSKGTLINIARGAIVDEREMVCALVEGRLGAAGLDVFENEPRVPQELFELDNVVLLPHLGTATYETRTDMVNLVVANLEAHFSGKPLLTPVP